MTNTCATSRLHCANAPDDSVNQPKPELIFPVEGRPETGQWIDINADIRWLRLPLPFQLAHINVWLLRDGDGWTLVDTGLFTKTTREIWKKVFEEDLDGLPIRRVIVTHLHPDHVGCAGWLTDRFDTELWMTRAEYLLCRILVADTGKPAPPAGTRFYHAAGFPPEAMERYNEHFGGFGRVVAPLPESYRRIADGMQFRIGDHDWQIRIGRGHSPEHACLLCPDLNMMIAGDQLLPSISPNISVYPTEPHANPLQNWFESIDAFEACLDPDVLVLPAHGRPFTGAQIRLEQLREEHTTGLQKLLDLCREPQRAVDVFPALFKSRISDSNLIMATGEAISHLHYLAYRDMLTCTPDEHDVNWYQSGQ